LLFFLASHEFGHYFAAKYHKVEATLPYFLPFPPTALIPMSFGTLGAVIKIKDAIPSRKALFDIGVAGPFAGFIVCVGYLIYGFATLPTEDFIYTIHPEFLVTGFNQTGIFFGDTILYWMLAEIFANPAGFLPPMNEMYHYPFLNVGWFGLFVTTLNLLPVGQLDGGHIIYAMFGRLQSKVALYAWYFIILISVLSIPNIILDMTYPFINDSSFGAVATFFYEPVKGFKDNFPILAGAWNGWIFWIFFLKYIIKIEHPPVMQEDNIGITRKILGWIAIVILILSFSYNGIYIMY